MQTSESLPDQFTAQATAAAAVVTRVADLSQALAYTVDVCLRKEACQHLMSGCGEPLSAGADTLCQKKPAKVLAAPNLAHNVWSDLQALCAEKDIELTQAPLRDHLAGIDIGLTLADYGIAETGTLVIDSSREAVRLATMISEIHVAVLPVDRIRASAQALEKELRTLMTAAPGYLAFITGASRTADIERVLAIGVHGPLELHILLMEEA